MPESFWLSIEDGNNIYFYRTKKGYFFRQNFIKHTEQKAIRISFSDFISAYEQSLEENEPFY